MGDNDRENENSIEFSNRSKKTIIKPCTARTWLNKLGYQYTDIKKGFFLNEHKRPDMIVYQAQFLKKLETLSLYLIEFRDGGSIEEKIYPSDYTVHSSNKRPAILIIYDKSTFLANNGWHQAWLKKGNIFLRSKGRGKGIMVSNFLLL